MKEQIISLLISKVGLSQDKAEQTVEAVFDYISQHPHQLTSYLDHFAPNTLKNGVGGFFQ